MFKKLLLVGAVLTSMVSFSQEVDFGFQAGYINMEGKSSSSIGNVSASGSSSGYFLGMLADFPVSENLHIRPSVNYANADETNILFVPILAQYYIQDSGFYFHAGPQATFLLDNVSLGGVDILKTFGLDLALGIGYEIDENFFLEAKYSFELTNRYTKEIKDAASSQGADVTSRLNALTLGIGYKF